MKRILYMLSCLQKFFYDDHRPTPRFAYPSKEGIVMSCPVTSYVPLQRRGGRPVRHSSLSDGGRPGWVPQRLLQLALLALEFCFFASFFPVFAAEPRQTMTWADCVCELIAHNPDLYVAQQNIQLAKTDVWRAYTLFIPSLGATASYNRGNERLDTGYQVSDTFDGDMTGSLNIFNGFRDLATLKQKQAVLNQTEIALKQKKADLGYTLTQKFYDLLRAQDALVLSEKIFKLRKENLELIRIRYETGSENKGNLMLSEVEYARAEEAIAEAKRAIGNAQRQLNTVLGRAEDFKIVVTGKWAIVNPPMPPDFEELVKTTPQYRQADIGHYLAKEDVRIAYGALYPTVDLTYDVGLVNENSSVVPIGDQWSIGAQAGITAFNLQLTDFLNLRDAKIKLRQNEATLRNTANTLADTLKSSFIGWQNAVVAYNIDVKLLEAQQMRYDIDRIKYENAGLIFEEWNRTQNSFIDAQTQVIAGQYQAVVTHAAWEKTLGNSQLP